MVEHDAAANCFREKALKNRNATDFLHAASLFDAAANRGYYSLYQAAVCALIRKGITPGQISSGVSDWRHGMVGGLLTRIDGRDRNIRKTWKSMKGLREKADYTVDSVEPQELADAVTKIDSFHKGVGI